MTVRFTRSSHRTIEEAARAEGITFAQYVREAALMRAATDAGRQMAGNPELVAVLERGIEMMRRRWEEAGGPDADT